MHFYSGKPMHFCSGVDTHGKRNGKANQLQSLALMCQPAAGEALGKWRG
jgi:hypothetical protein